MLRPKSCDHEVCEHQTGSSDEEAQGVIGVWGVWVFRVKGLGFRVRVLGLGCRISGLGLEVSVLGFGLRIGGLGVEGLRSKVWV